MTDSNEMESSVVELCLPAGVAVEPAQASAEWDGEISDLALPQNFVTMAESVTAASAIPLRKPGKQVWFSPHPDPKVRMNIAVLELKDEGEVYIISPKLLRELAGEWTPKVLVPCISKQGALALWPIGLPDADGKHNSWHASALQIANEYAGQWVRLKPNREGGGYDVMQPVSVFAPPVWPENLRELLEKAMRARVIDSLEHRVIKNLRGAQ